MLLVFLKWALDNISHGIMKTLLMVYLQILNLLLYIKVLIVVTNWTTIHYPIKNTSILGICTTNYLIPPIYTELMGGHIHMRKGDNYLCLRDFPKDNLILKHYMISAWRFQLLDGLGYYAICSGAVAQNLVMTVGIYCKVITDCKELTQEIILLPDQCREGIHNKIRNTTWRII